MNTWFAYLKQGVAVIRNSDRILLLNENRLKDAGTHARLMEWNAYYRTRVVNQQRASQARG